MNGQVFYDKLLDGIEAELAGVNVFLTAAARERMASVLDRIDHVRTPQHSVALRRELERHLQEIDDEATSTSCPPETWLPAVECA